jgi:hypothetical protein
MKKCGVCGIEKHTTDFTNQNGRISYRCKKCISEYNKQYYQKNQSKLKQRTQQFRNENPEYMKEWRKNNKTRVQKQKRNWLNKNRILINEKERNKRKINPAYKIKKNLRRRVNQVITRNDKSNSTMSLIGCSVYELLLHLEKQFTNGMTWNNYGKWHIDHIKPCASFDLTDPEQQKKCFHYTNLQPLWAADNIQKSDKVLDNEQ